jgi:hypothetical protein
LERKKITTGRKRFLFSRNLSRRQLRLLGFLPLTFFFAQAIHYWQINELGHMLWMCNIGNLLLALGLFLEQPLVVRVAVIWMVPGVVVWCFYVVPTWGTLLTGNFDLKGLFGVISSSLAHLGGFSVGLITLRQVRIDGRAWLFAFAWYFVMQLLSRLITPSAMNVNLSHNIQSGWEQSFSSYWKFWLLLTVLVGICLWILGRLLRILWPSEPSPV